MRFRIRLRAADVVMIALAVLLTGVAIIAAAPPDESAPAALDHRLLDRLDTLSRSLLDENIGHAPPAFTDDLQWPGGEALDLAALRGRVVVIQSWTTKTGPGRALPKRVHDLLSDFSPEDVQIIALHTPEGADTAPTFLERRPAEVPVVIDPVGAYCDALGIYRRPANILIDRQGAVRFAGVKTAALERAAALLVAEPFDADAAPPSPRPAGAARPADFPAATGSPGGAKDFRGKRAPDFYVQQWLTAEPDGREKVTIVEFWATWCGPCRKSIPHLNKLAAEFSDDLVIVGVSNETSSKIQQFMGEMPMRYAVATDPSSRMLKEVGIRGIPHALVMSRDWTVRWQGHPALLDASVVRQIIEADTGAKDRRRYRWTG